jgi:hypothetical protein
MLFRDLIDYLTDTCKGVSSGIAFWATLGFIMKLEFCHVTKVTVDMQLGS